MACYALSDAFDGGFFRGLFLGATIALMVLGAYLVGAGRWFSSKDEDDLRNGGIGCPAGTDAMTRPADMATGPGTPGAWTQPTGRHATLEQAIGWAILGPEEPGTLDPSDPDDHLAIVRRAAAAESVARGLLQQAVRAARGSGRSWATIGSELGLSRQGVQQRFGSQAAPEDTPEYRWLGPVTAFNELRELELAGRLGWHTVEAGMLRHKMVRTPTQWEHRRVRWTGPVRRFEQDGWQVGCRAFPWVYLIRDLGKPADPAPDEQTSQARTSPT